MVDAPNVMQLWEPRHLIRSALEGPSHQDGEGMENALLLVFALDSFTCDLARGLGASDSQDGIAFQTAHQFQQASLPVSHRPLIGEPACVQALVRLARSCCYIAAVRKRSHGSFLEIVSVGRARNHDIVLRHPSVSKFHASLEIRPGSLYVKDAGGRNGTFVDDERVTSGGEAKPGNYIRFGMVNAMVCTERALSIAARQVRGK